MYIYDRDLYSLTAILAVHVYNFNLMDAKNWEDHFAIKYWGKIKIPVPGEYTFYTNSDDGSKLLINGKLVVDNNGSHSVRQKGGTISLSKGKHKIEVQYLEDYADQHLDVSIKEPGKPRQLVNVEMLSSN